MRSAVDARERPNVEGRKTDRPTGAAVLYMLRHIDAMHVHLKNGGRILRILKAAETRVLALLDIDAGLLVAVQAATTEIPSTDAQGR